MNDRVNCENAAGIQGRGSHEGRGGQTGVCGGAAGEQGSRPAGRGTEKGGERSGASAAGSSQGSPRPHPARSSALGPGAKLGKASETPLQSESSPCQRGQRALG